MICKQVEGCLNFGKYVPVYDYIHKNRCLKNMFETKSL